MKKKYILLAVLLGPAVLLFDYPKYKKDIWIIFVCSILSVGILYFLIFWPLVVLAAIFNSVPKTNKLHNPFNRDNSVKSKPFWALLVLTIFCYTILYLYMLYGLAYMLVFLELGNDTNFERKTDFAHWTLVWFSIIVIPIFVVSLHKLTSKIGRFVNTLFLIGIIVVFSLGVSWVRTSTTENTANNSCDINATMLKAGAGTYPIATDVGYGTGFAIDGTGNIVTAYHVVEGAKEVYLNLDTGKIEAKVIRTAPEHDLALIKAKTPAPSYVNLNVDYQVTQDVYALGWPGNTFNIGSLSVSKGIVSRIINNKDIKSEHDVPDDLQLVQTDAAINPGNSGGPLVNACGVIGAVLAKSDTRVLQDYGIASEEGISYAVSAETIKSALGLQ